jgi:hypothetical protein
MNGRSHSNHENLVNTGYWEGSGPRYGTAGQVRFPGKQGIEAAAKAPAGAAAPIVMGVWGHQPPSYLPA